MRRASLKRTVPAPVKWKGGVPPPDVEEDAPAAPVASTFARRLAPPPAPAPVPVSEPVYAPVAVKVEDNAAHEPVSPPEAQQQQGPVRVIAPSIREVVIEGCTGILTLPPCRTDHVARRFRIMLMPMDD